MLAPDLRDDGMGEADTLRRAWSLLVRERASYPQTVATLNAEGRSRRDGAPWTVPTLRAALTDPSVTGTFLWASGAATSGRWGPPKPLSFPGVLTEDEHAVLLAAHARPDHKPYDPRRFYLLSGRFTARCGASRHGVYRNDRDTRSYRCAARKNRAGCGCVHLDTPATDERVWAAVAGFLADADRMSRMADDYLGLRHVQVGVERDELAQIRAHAASLERAITSTLVDYARQGIDPAATAAATRALQDELTATREREAAILTWQTDSAAEALRVHTLAEIATAARDRLDTMTDSDRAEVLTLLDVQVTETDTGLTITGHLAWLDLHSTLMSDPGNPSESDLWVHGASQQRLSP